MAIRFFFEFNNQVIQLPVNPEKITINSEGTNKTEEIVKLGTINILRQKNLETCEIECFLPATSEAPYVLTKGDFREPQFYIDFFEQVRAAKKPMRFMISDTKVNMLVGIESFDYTLQAGDNDFQYVIKLKEYRPYSAKTVKINLPSNRASSATVTTTTTIRGKTGFAIGDSVIVNGKYWYTSYGESPFGTFNNFNGRISHIVADTGRAYRYHITTPTGGYRGWVSASQMRQA